MNELETKAIKGAYKKMREWLTEAERLSIAGERGEANRYIRSVREVAFTVADLEVNADTQLLERFASWA